MILPIVGYGSPVLRQQAQEIDSSYAGLDALIADMFDTMANADGVGLAAPQIGRSIALFVIDLSHAKDDYPELADFKRAFINPVILEELGEPTKYNEGCLSVPDIHEDVMRPSSIRVEYYNEKWELVEEVLEGFPARVFQHEFDHLEGVIFTDHVSGFKKRLLKGRLTNITKGNISSRYKMRFGVKDLEPNKA